MKQIAVDSSMKKLSTEALQIVCVESPLASFLLVLSFYGESLGGCGFATVLPTIALQAPLDRARGELPSDTRTLISHREKFHGKTDEIWRSVITTTRPKIAFFLSSSYLQERINEGRGQFLGGVAKYFVRVWLSISLFQILDTPLLYVLRTSNKIHSVDNSFVQ